MATLFRILAVILVIIRGKLVLGIVARDHQALRRSRRSQHHMTRRTRSPRRSRHRSSCLRVSEVLAVIGELDVVTTSRLMERLASTPTIRILDLSGVRFIDPAGLRILLDIVRTDPQLVIRAPSACVRRLCSLAGLDHIATASCSGPWSAARVGHQRHRLAIDAAVSRPGTRRPGRASPPAIPSGACRHRRPRTAPVT